MYRYADTGDVYRGMFENGRSHGQGTMVWANGSVFEGQWRDAAQHGPGIQRTGSGTVTYQGQWEHGEQMASVNV